MDDEKVDNQGKYELVGRLKTAEIEMVHASPTEFEDHIWQALGGESLEGRTSKLVELLQERHGPKGENTIRIPLPSWNGLRRVVIEEYGVDMKAAAATVRYAKDRYSTELRDMGFAWKA